MGILLGLFHTWHFPVTEHFLCNYLDQSRVAVTHTVLQQTESIRVLTFNFLNVYRYNTQPEAFHTIQGVDSVRLILFPVVCRNLPCFRSSLCSRRKVLKLLFRGSCACIQLEGCSDTSWSKLAGMRMTQACVTYITYVTDKCLTIIVFEHSLWTRLCLHRSTTSRGLYEAYRLRQVW